jgi:murein DD-endopeptidase MepM/ murein hydrolase activator NlpD
MQGGARSAAGQAAGKLKAPYKKTAGNISKAKQEFAEAKRQVRNMKSAAGKTAAVPPKKETAIRAQDTARRTARARQAANNTVKTAGWSEKTVKQSAKTAKTAGKSVKTAGSTAKTAVKATQQAAKTTQRTAQTAARTARMAAQASRASAKASIITAKAAIKVTIAAVKAIIAAANALIAVIAAGGWIAVAVILIVCLAGLLLGSVFGIFFSGEDSGNGYTIKAAIGEINAEYSAKISEIKDGNAHDEVVMSGSRADWKEMLVAYAVKVNTDQANAQDVATMDEGKKELLRSVFWDMNIIACRAESVSYTETAVIEDEDGNLTETEQAVTKTFLYISVTGHTAAEMAIEYGFTVRQNAQLNELLSSQYDDLWAALLGVYQSANGERRMPSQDRIPTGILTWPLEQAGTITSWFGYRQDPFTGETVYHNGTDIAAPDGTPILAAADGTVTIANMADSYAGGWGYYVRISHAGGFETLYAHCSALAVRQGEDVKQGQVIAYIGSTGRSTGNHLHWELYKNGQQTDALAYFQ